MKNREKNRDTETHLNILNITIGKNTLFSTSLKNDIILNYEKSHYEYH